jgi:hypothetical protein
MAVYFLIKILWLPNFSVLTVVTLSSIISSIIVITLSSSLLSRKIWAVIAWFDKSLFPDLNGSWKGKIILENGEELEARAVIRQSLLATQIDMHSETAKSITLETTPTIEQGQKKLYYLYRATPKNPAWESYNGSTLFDIRFNGDGSGRKVELSGYYYTDRKTTGRVSLVQICNDSNNDVSFY